TEVAQPMRNPKLRDLGNNAWIKLAPLDKDQVALGSPWCYDPGQKRFVRVGGITFRGQIAESNEVTSFDLGTETWTTILPYSRSTENYQGIGHGTRRGICYDRDRHCIWEDCYGSVWQGVGDLARSKWKKLIVAADGTYTSTVAYDEGAKRLICLSFNAGGFLTQIYDPV